MGDSGRMVASKKNNLSYDRNLERNMTHFFFVVTDEVTKEIQSEILWWMTFADDTVLVEDNSEC